MPRKAKQKLYKVAFSKVCLSMSGEKPNMEPGETQVKRMVQVTSENVIRIPRGLVWWKLPLVYTVESVRRDGDKITIVVRIISEGVVK